MTTIYSVVNFPTHTDNNNEPVRASDVNNIQDGLKAVQQKVLDSDIGDLANLTTTNKNTVVEAINEVKSNSIPTSQKGANSGVASLDSSGKVPTSQIPTLSYVPSSEKGANNGVATLDGTGKVTSSQLPNLSNDMVKIAEVTLGANTTSIDFNSIPQTYKHLVLKGSIRSTVSGSLDDVCLRFNGVSTNVYQYHYICGNSGTVIDIDAVTQSSIKIGRSAGNTGTAGFFTPIECNILDYASTTLAKGVLFQSQTFYNVIAGTQINYTGGGFSSATSAISSLSIFNTGQFLAGSTLTLYGVK